MNERVGPSPWATRGGTLALLLVSMFMYLWGSFEGFLESDPYSIRLSTLLLVGAAMGFLGGVVAGVLLLIGRFRPTSVRRRWRVAAVVVLAVAVVGGPARSAAQYAWLVSTRVPAEESLVSVAVPAAHTPSRTRTAPRR